ncbi:MAG TPA: metallophosphoesterase [Candidatus Saccharimonadales bacterium]|nr:metallophosphoesterase [Candidatus Saccharimonadales bacterium]
MLILFTSDLHGEPALYEQLFGLIAARRPGAVLLGGDICPTHFGPEGPPIQRRFLEQLFARFERIAAAQGTRFFFIFGNADCRANWEWLVGRERSHAVPVHGRVLEMGEGLCVAGYNYVPVTHLALKDWEKRDLRVTGTERWEGIVTLERGMEKVDLRKGDPADTLERDFQRLGGQLDSRPTICVLHSPPADTHLDCIGGGRHVGSLAARGFLERTQPALALSGHIHESPRLSGRYADRLGRTLCVNPGQTPGGRLHAVLFDSADPAGTLTHTVLGSAGGVPGAPPG